MLCGVHADKMPRQARCACLCSNVCARGRIPKYAYKITIHFERPLPPPPRARSFVAADNHIHDMKDAGFAILESMNAEIYDNIVENVKYGIRISLGGADNNIHDNTFDGCTSCEC